MKSCTMHKNFYNSYRISLVLFADDGCVSESMCAVCVSVHHIKVKCIISLKLKRTQFTTINCNSIHIFMSIGIEALKNRLTHVLPCRAPTIMIMMLTKV